MQQIINQGLVSCQIPFHKCFLLLFCMEPDVAISRFCSVAKNKRRKRGIVRIRLPQFYLSFGERVITV